MEPTSSDDDYWFCEGIFNGIGDSIHEYSLKHGLHYNQSQTANRECYWTIIAKDRGKLLVIEAKVLSDLVECKPKKAVTIRNTRIPRKSAKLIFNDTHRKS